MTNTINYCKSRWGVVEYVEGLLIDSNPDLPLTMTIKQANSEGFFVHTATGESLLGTDENTEQACYRQHLNTLHAKNTQDG